MGFSSAFLLLAWAAPEKPEAVALLEARCVGCHNAANRQSGLDLSTREAALRGGDRGPLLGSGPAKESFLYRVLAHTAKPAMPKFGARLTEPELTLVARWIEAGAPWTNAPAVTAAPARPSHWAFQKPVRPAVPGAGHPVDAFLRVEREKRGLTVLREADRPTLLRRLFLDVVGVPPTPAELERFAGAPWEQVVDAVLADARYGERWGRHWMDIWRYSDWYGYRRSNEVRNSQKFVWRWRDWIIESLNAGKPYDRMVAEMLAGDEIAPADPDTLRATGYLARNYSRYDRDGWMQDAVDHTLLAFTGITVKCARCHDHKYDPITQEEYYRLRAVFEPYDVRIDRVPGEVDPDKDGLARIYDAHADRATHLLIRGNVAAPDRSRTLEPGVPAAFGLALPAAQPVALPVAAYYPDQREFVFAALLGQAKAAIEKAKDDPAARAAAEAELPALEARIAAERAKFADPPDPRFEELAAKARELERRAGLLRGAERLAKAQAEMAEAMAAAKPDEKKVAAANKKMAEATAALTQPATGYTPIGKEYPAKSTGRRTAFAQWITSPENPLTARVAVNHVWLRHFGAALVPTVADFGKSGQAPTHPALLDYLATEFVRSGWNLKALHRLLLTSSAYRLRSSAGTAEHPNLKADAENRYLWRMNARPLEAEAVRDSILAVAGELDGTRGGVELDSASGMSSRRRSLYYSQSPDLQMEFLKVFDGPNPVECYQRTTSVVPQQALALANSQLSQEMAAKLAARLEGPALVERAFVTVLGRRPSAAEQALAAGATPANLVHALFNHTDFVTIR